jgi:metal transporter CNNM
MHLCSWFWFAGALEYSNKEVRDVMTPINEVFMLEASTKLTFDAKLEIYKSGYTRIPVYDGTVSKDHVINVLYVKDLILVDPDDEIEVQTVVSFRCSCLYTRRLQVLLVDTYLVSNCSILC